MFDVYFHLGEVLLQDDAADIGRYSFEGHPSPFHHWQWGLIIMLASVLGEMALMAMDVSKELNNIISNDTNVNSTAKGGSK